MASASASDAEPEMPYVEFGMADVYAGGLASILEGPAAALGEPMPEVARPEGSAGERRLAGSDTNV